MTEDWYKESEKWTYLFSSTNLEFLQCLRAWLPYPSSDLVIYQGTEESYEGSYWEEDEFHLFYKGLIDQVYLNGELSHKILAFKAGYEFSRFGFDNIPYYEGNPPEKIKRLSVKVKTFPLTSLED